MHLSRYMRYWAAYRGDEVAFICEDEQLNWHTYVDQCAAVAYHWARSGIAPGDRVGCLLPNSMDWCVAFGASILLGAPLVPLNMGFGAPELGRIIEDSGCRALVSQPALVAPLGVAGGNAAPNQTCLFLLDGSVPPQALAAQRQGPGLAQLHLPEQDENELLIIAYTSGTTGLPKGAMLTHRGVAEVSRGLANALDWAPGERFLVLAPLAFTGGVILNLASNVVTGGTAYIEPRLVPDAVLPKIAQERISVCICVPVIWQRIAESADFENADISCLKAAITGGAPVSPALLQRYLDKGVVIRQAYGCTEAAGAIAMPDTTLARTVPTSCGRPLVGIDLEIRDSHGQQVPVGEVGEICVRGPQVMRGYWKNELATEEAMVNGWYHTGDLARRDANGGMTIVDRKKSLIISGGVNIYPAEVERALAALEGVVEVAVIGVPSPAWGEEVVALVHAAPTFDTTAATAQARELLGGLKAPKQIRLSATPLPRTASGKVDRSRLSAVFASLPAPATAGAVA